MIVEIFPYYENRIWGTAKVGNYILVSQGNSGLYIFYDNGLHLELKELIRPSASNLHFLGIAVDTINKRLFVAQHNSSSNEGIVHIYDASWLE